VQILLVCLWIVSGIFSGTILDEPDYKNKQLLWELQKINSGTDYKELDIPENIKQEWHGSGKYFIVNGKKSESRIVYVYVGRVNSCRFGGCTSDIRMGNTGFEYFDYFIFYDKNHVVQLVKVFNYQASKGHEITSRGWLKQFTGYNGKTDLRIGKQIDGISGATISANAICNDIQLITKRLIAIVEFK